MNWLRKKLHSFVFLKTPLGEALTVAYSALLHFKHSFSDTKPDFEKDRLEYYIVKHCHIIEKGLAMPQPRKGFGQPKIENLIRKTKQYEYINPTSTTGVMVRDTLREYLNFHEDLQIFSREFLKSIQDFINERPIEAAKGGLEHVNKAEMEIISKDTFEKFITCRHSVRNFDSTPVDNEIILRALAIAQNSPSVCNRQGWFVHYYSDKNKIQDLLHFQNGNAGFSQSIDKLLIVTGSNKAFSRYEHNQLFIDGGLYSMNLMLALHAVGLGSCPLNTCMPWRTETRLKKAAGIPTHERPIMMIAIGNLHDEFVVAQSEKYPFEKIVRFH